jgi:uncharacterized protein (TIGR03067 family)
MKRYALGIVAVALLVGGTAAQDAKEDMKKLEGTWVVVSAERDGKNYDRIKDDQVVFAGDKITIKSKERDQKGTYKLDPSKKPKALDLISDNAGDPPVHGIYEFKGEELRICFSRPGKDRPTAFATQAGSEMTLVVMKRVKS